MQVERFTSVKSGGRVSNAWVTYPVHTDNIPKGMLIRDNIFERHLLNIKGEPVQDGPASAKGMAGELCTEWISAESI
ncbi:hypothetical protein XC52_12425 [Clostridioides difficile]|nr:hypothetical protein XC52_12425 [Clostridioides difficile]